MMSRDPTLIIRRRAARHSRSIRSDHTDLVCRVDLLPTVRRASCPFASFALTALLREECRNPGAIDEIARAAEQAGEEEVEEYSKHPFRLEHGFCETRLGGRQRGVGLDIHLRIKNARVGLDHTNCLVEGLNGVSIALVVRDHGREAQLQFLRVQLRHEAIAHTLAGGGRDLHIVACSCQVADILHPILREWIGP